MIDYFDKEKVNQLFPNATMIPPMLIWKLSKTQESKFTEICASRDYYGELKKDGVLYELNLASENETYLFGRTVSVKTGLLTEKSANVPHIIDAFKKVPKDTVILGELYYKNGTSKNVVSITGCLPEKAIERQNGDYGKLRFYIYDILKFNGTDLLNTGALDRKKLLEEVYEKYLQSDNEYIDLAETIYNDLQKFSAEALLSGEEGVVLKLKDGIYAPGKRPA